MNHHPYSLTLRAKETARTTEAEFERRRQLAIAREARSQRRSTDQEPASQTPSVWRSLRKELSMRRLFSALAILLVVGSAFTQSTPRAGTEVLWDSWGVPHIYAASDADAFYAYGWAQARNHGELILRLYAQARGEGSKHYGPADLEVDKAALLVRLPERAEEWYEAQSPAFRLNLDAFAAGFTAYVAGQPGEFTAAGRSVLPVRATDLLAHTIRDLSTFIASECALAVPGLQLGGQPGSNGWAISPSRSESGNALLLANPHLGWGGSTLFFEAQIETPTYSSYGATLVGVPVPVIAFNDHHGWTHTTNTLDGCDLYSLELADGGYLLDGVTNAFETSSHAIEVLQDDGSLSAVPFEVHRSAHGPVVHSDGQAALAMRMVGVDVADFPGLLEQWWDMARATGLDEFQDVLARHQLPTQNVIYADADGHTLLLYAGRVPVRAGGDVATWRTPVPGNDSALIWTDVLAHEDLPSSVDPATGWVQNSNSAPWFMTAEGAPNPDEFPAYLSPRGPLNLREQRGIALLTGDDAISLDELVEYKHDTFAELFARVGADLVAAARASESQAAQAAAEVLAEWDGRMEADRAGAALFYAWFMTYVEVSAQRAAQSDPSFVLTGEADLYGAGFFAVPWSEDAPLDTPRGLANPDLAVMALEAAVGALGGQADLPWGAVARMRFGEVDVPAAGGPGVLGVFRAIDPTPAPDGRYQAYWGDAFVAAVEFGDSLEAMVLNTYGNASQSGSPHAGDALALAVKQELRPAWLTRADVEANLEDRVAW